jgi:hypothetical protein
LKRFRQLEGVYVLKTNLSPRSHPTVTAMGTYKRKRTRAPSDAVR